MNFLKAYKDRVEGVPSYDEDYAYFLYDEFIQKFIPQVIKGYFSKDGKKSKEIKIAISSIYDFFINNKGYKKLESVMPTVIEYIRIFGFDIKNGHILIDPKNLIYSYYDYLMLDEVRLDEVSLTRSEDETLTRGDFSSKEASEMSSVDESIFSDIFYRRPSVASYYVPREEMISDYTFEIFEREIIKMLVQLVVGAINNNQDSIRVDFIVNHNSVVFNNKEFYGVNRDELMEYIVSTPCKLISKAGNKAVLQYSTNELKTYFVEETQRNEYERKR